MTHPTDDSLKPCPFCGAGTTEITPNGRMWTGMKYSEPSSVSVRHWCEAVPGQPSRMLERVGRDKASAIEAWNTRALLAEQARTEPVAWVYWHPSDTTYDGPDTLHKKAVSRFTDDTRKAMMAKGWLFEPLYPASTVAQPLKAEQAKDAAEDAELLDWIFRQGDEFSYYVIQDAPGDGEYVVHGMGCSGQGKTPRAAIRAARAAERKA